MLAAGLMSGTSLDGVDVALVEIAGQDENTKLTLKQFTNYPFTQGLKTRIKNALSLKSSNVKLICSLDFELGKVFADSVKKACATYGIDYSKLAYISSHCQTIYHLPDATFPDASSTLQIGNPSVICELTQTTVIANFRERDIAVKGQGAPIVTYSEYILYRSHQYTRILQNIGGIGNATILPKNGTFDNICAFDTGPGNMIIDELCRHFYNTEFDWDGKHSASGQVDQMILQQLLRHPYFSRKPPKTTGREMFGIQYVRDLLTKYHLKPDDWIATATALTAKSIAESIRPFIKEPAQLIISGGGSYNPTLLKMLTAYLPDVAILRQENLGSNSNAKEAIAMTILGNQTLHHRPSNVPAATGAKRQVILGSIVYYD